FESDSAGGRYVYEIGPFSVAGDSLRIFDVTDPYAPVEILSPEVATVAGGRRLRFNRIESGRHRYRILPDYESGSRIIKPPNTDVFDAAGSSANLRSGPPAGADYLLIYYDRFGTAAQSLAGWRNNHLPLVGIPAPYDTMSVPISALYDQFSGGRMDPAAIRNFLRAVKFNWNKYPTFVTLLGDASSDFKNITGAAPPGEPGALVPSYEGGFDLFVQRQYATDDWLLNVDDPIRVIPDFLGGRIPAPNAAQALSYVRDKLQFYERDAPFDEWRARVMLIADDNEQGSNVDPIGWGHMQQTVRLDVEAVPPSFDRKYVYLHTYPDVGETKPKAKQDIIDFIENGVVLSNYIGHGSPFKLADESVFLDMDADRLRNRERLTIFVAASCDVGKFNSTTGQGLGERLLFNPNGGAVGVVSATELALSNQNAKLNLDLFLKLFARDTTTTDGTPATGQYEATLAEGLLVAKTGYPNNQKYQVMGDAALRPNFPRLWVETSVTDEDGNPVTTVQRGQTMKVNGRLLDRPGGSQVTLDGLAHVLIEDSAPVDTLPECLANCAYPFRASPVFRGDVSLAGGLFSTRFVMPIDARLGPRGRARPVVTVGSGTNVTDGAGVDSMIVAAGTAPSGDVTGPRIQLSFVGGSTRVRPDAVLRVDLFDESGILITGNSPQNGIIVTVDESSTQRYDVTPSFRYAGNSYQSGVALFTLPNLSPGLHRIRVSAADNLAAGITAADHRSSAAIEFEVTDSPALQVTRIILFPNPIRSGGQGGGGQFVIDAPGDSVDVLLKIYTVSGRMIRSLRSERGLAQAQIPWDGLDAEGEPLARGTYLFKAQVFTGLSGNKAQRQSAESVGRFVVVGR
ncbi:MAG TPA: C25 family cysteine peptidase, partial [Candidatus Eisenbacteria bacterium]|nr:C25 family cysteine peptidase [Candidatus Eisenbacteria bacterium]